jgi:hypothetical protein
VSGLTDAFRVILGRRVAGRPVRVRALAPKDDPANDELSERRRAWLRVRATPRRRYGRGVPVTLAAPKRTERRTASNQLITRRQAKDSTRRKRAAADRASKVGQS